MTSKKWLVILGVAAILILCVNGVEALDNVTLNTPAASATICGSTYSLNATTGGGNATNVTFYYYNSGWIAIGSNATNGTTFTLPWDTTAVSDGTYTVNATATNGTATVYDNSTGVIIDNTGPVVSFASGSPADNGQMDYQSAISVTTSESATACTLYFGNEVLTMSGSGTSWSYTFNSGPTENIYSYYITCTDTTSCTNSANSATRTVTVKNSNSGGGGGAATTKKSVAPTQSILSLVEKIKSGNKLVIIGALLIGLVIAYSVFGKGKGNKK